MGLGVVPPSGWEVAIYRRMPGPGEATFPILHAATVPLPPKRGDYGGGLVELLGPMDAFVALLEFGPKAAASPLFTAFSGLPSLAPASFRPRQLQRAIRGQAGVQRFFTSGGRAFCLYSVIGSMANCSYLATRANELVGSLRIDEA